MSAATPTTMDPDIQRIASIGGSHDLTVAECAAALETSEDTISRAVGHGDLESKRYIGRGRGGSARRPRIRISRAALVIYVVRSSTGDRSVVLAAIDQLLPEYSAIARQAVQQTTPAGETAPLPENVIPIRRRKAPADPYAGHPELFG